MPIPGEWVGELETLCRSCGERLVVTLGPDGNVSVCPGEVRPSSARSGRGRRPSFRSSKKRSLGRCSPWPATVETDGNGPIGDPTGGSLRGTLGDLGALRGMPGCSER